MKTYYLDCANMYDRQSAHDYLEASPELPDYYGRNLDALADCLTELLPCHIVLENSKLLEDEDTDPYCRRIMSFFRSFEEDEPLFLLETL